MKRYFKPIAIIILIIMIGYNQTEEIEVPSITFKLTNTRYDSDISFGPVSETDTTWYIMADSGKTITIDFSDSLTITNIRLVQPYGNNDTFNKIEYLIIWDGHISDGRLDSLYAHTH